MGSKYKASASFYLLGAVGILLLPIRWWMGAFLAATVHEVFHCLAIRICGGEVCSISLEGMGARIEASPMTAGKEVFCALAGPLGSFSVLIASEYFPELAICGLIQGAYNLLPIFPLDGGRAVHCIFPEPVCRGIELFTLTFLSGICLWLWVNGLHFGIILIFFLWHPLIQRKISCKDSKLAVQ